MICKHCGNILTDKTGYIKYKDMYFCVECFYKIIEGSRKKEEEQKLINSPKT